MKNLLIFGAFVYCYLPLQRLKLRKRTNDLVGCIMEIMDYVLRTHKNARKEMNEMGGKVLETYTEKLKKEHVKKYMQLQRIFETDSHLSN